MANNSSKFDNLFNGFSLVELSIVLVILGLLTGGILTGQSLIKAAELRAVTTETSQFAAAVNAFQDKYFALPGDMTNATSFWTGGVTDDGNGDGDVHCDCGSGNFSELYTFWQQLALAGLINGNYTGRSGANNDHESIPGVNIPQSKLAGAGYSLDTDNVGGWLSDSYSFAPGNYMTFGKPSTVMTHDPVLTPEEAWNIDKKMDDGKPGRGLLISAVYGNNCTAAANSGDLDADYLLTGTSVACSLMFVEPY